MSHPAICQHLNKGRRLFCPECGKGDPDDIKSVKLKGFTGAASLNPKVDEFFETGDPDVFQKP